MTKRFPEQGKPWAEIKQQMLDFKNHDVKWKQGRAAVYVFDPGPEVIAVAHEAYSLFISENGLGPGAFPSLKTMEREVIAMALDLQEAPEDAYGAMTSGGSESIFMAVKACFSRAKSLDTFNTVPEILAPDTAHPAFDKAAQTMGLNVVRIPTQAGYLADPKAMQAAITENTIMLVGSAPNFPFGVIDPISELSELAQQHKLWLHVDACVGGYIAPFAKANGETIADYNFSLAGVSSMSADLHKFGYAAKGASTVLYRGKELGKYQIFDFNNWPCGRMMTPTMAGTRPGGAIASAWAVMHFLGKAGYQQKAEVICNTRKALTQGVQELGFHLLGEPAVSIMTFAHDSLDTLAIGEQLFAKGWISSRTQSPPGIQLMLSPGHAEVVDDYLADLKQARDHVAASGDTASQEVSYN